LPFDRKARRQFAEYVLRAPFSLDDFTDLSFFFIGDRSAYDLITHYRIIEILQS
jgi:hypothetical protein